MAEEEESTEDNRDIDQADDDEEDMDVDDSTGASTEAGRRTGGKKIIPPVPPLPTNLNGVQK